MKKALKIALIAVVALVLLVSLFARALVRMAVVWAVEKETGLDLEIGGLRTGKLRPWFEITDFRLMNPEGFDPEPCVHIAKLHVQYRPLSLFSDTVRISRLYLDISRVLIVEEGGESNLDPLVEKTLSAPRSSAEAPPAPEARTVYSERYPVPPPAFTSSGKSVSIGEFELKLGTLELRRRAPGDDVPVIQEFVFDETFVFTNVSSPDQIVQRVASGFLVKQLTGALLEPGAKSVQDTLTPRR